MKLYSRLVAACILSLMLVGQLSAQDQPTPEERAYKFRTSLFETFGWKYGQLIGAQKQGDEAAFAKHAGDLANLSTMLLEGFQIENSLPDGTKAKPEIWEDFEKFEEKAGVLNAAAVALSEPGAMADFDPRGFGSKTCGNCHRDFKVKDE